MLAPRVVASPVAVSSVSRAVVVFLVLPQLSALGGVAGRGAAAPLSIGAGAVGMLLLKEVGGALVLALAAGIVTYQMLKRVDNY